MRTEWEEASTTDFSKNIAKITTCRYTTVTVTQLQLTATFDIVTL
jgi:hypothetical protein